MVRRLIITALLGIAKTRQPLFTESNMLYGALIFYAGAGALYMGFGVTGTERYIKYAKKRYPQAGKEFRCVDVTTFWNESSEYDIVLLVDFLHHLPARDCVRLLKIAANLARRYVVSFEPVSEQTNPIGRWIITYDRGDHVIPLEKLHGLFDQAGLPIAQSRELYLGPIRSRAILCCKTDWQSVPRYRQAANEFPRAA